MHWYGTLFLGKGPGEPNPEAGPRVVVLAR